MAPFASTGVVHYPDVAIVLKLLRTTIAKVKTLRYFNIH